MIGVMFRCGVLIIHGTSIFRYVSENKAEALALPSVIVDGIVPRAWSAYARRRLMPAEDTDDGLVYFCRRVYDFHGKRILRNPSF